jgi:hypothetical protein
METSMPGRKMGRTLKPDRNEGGYETRRRDCPADQLIAALHAVERVRGYETAQN